MGRSTVQALPDDLRADLDRAIAAGRLTLDDLRDWLATRGEAVSRSALGRYSQRVREVSARLTKERELWTAFKTDMAAAEDADALQASATMLTALFTRWSAAALTDGTPIDPIDLGRAAKAIRDLQAAAVARESWRRDVIAQMAGALGARGIDISAVLDEVRRDLGVSGSPAGVPGMTTAGSPGGVPGMTTAGSPAGVPGMTTAGSPGGVPGSDP